LKHPPLISPLMLITVKTVNPTTNAFINKSLAPFKYLADMTMVMNQVVMIISDQKAYLPPWEKLGPKGSTVAAKG